MTITPALSPNMTDSVPIVVDWRPFHTDRTLIEAATADGGVTLIWDDHRRTQFNRFFLRDNCPCTECVLPLTREQVFEIVDAPDTLAADTLLISAVPAHSIVSNPAEGQTLLVNWSDGHASAYPAGWLRAHATDATSRAERQAQTPKPFIWGAEHADGLGVFAHDRIMSEPTELLDWLVALRDAGLTLVRNVPTEPNALLGPAERISHVRETNFGRVFDVRSKPTPDSAAYTAVNLPPHTDLPTRELQPGYQFLHCLLNNATGGESIFVDGFAIAQAMRMDYPAHFAMLTTTPLPNWNRDDRTDYRWSAPLIALDAEGAVTEIRFANFLRGPIDAPTEQMPTLYAALRQFQAMIRDARFRIERRLTPGDMWVFDNRRVMHARRAFDPRSGARHLQGVYVDRDEVRSRIHILSRQTK